MTTQDRNAAIWFSADGYDPAKGVNGRRMAGESFLRGWLAHAQVPEFVSISHGTTDAGLFAAVAKDMGVAAPVRAVRLDAPQHIAPVGAIYYSGPNYAPEAWRRAHHGAASWSICGLTHTMSTKAVMQGVFDLRAAPSQEWDAVICTSRAVQTAMRTQLDLVDDFLARRFGGALPPRFQTPVVPLGIVCDAFRTDPAQGKALRDRLGIAAGDVAALIVGRLTPHEKFDPLPVYIALSQAQKGMAPGTRLHLILFGRFPDAYAQKVFESGARALMPDVGFHTLADTSSNMRLAALAAGDMFLFPIDNLQESFGIAPVEAMAAGLPVIGSDWDGIKDTVDGGAGIRVPTLGSRPEHGALTAQRHFGGTDNYIQYLSQTSAITRIDVAALAQAVLALARDPGLRAQMGAAARVRARQMYDWSAVIPQLQDLFGELSAIRARATAADHPATPGALLPVAPAPMALFSAFPTARIAHDDRRWCAVDLAGRPGIADTLALRDYMGTRRIFDAEPAIVQVADAIATAGSAGALVSDLATATRFHPLRVERIVLWLAKYHFITEAS